MFKVAPEFADMTNIENLKKGGIIQMGFAASQARFLSLTSRLSDTEYEAAQIAQERLALNSQMELYADEYDAATNNQAVYANVFDMEGKPNETVVLSYDVITQDIFSGGLGMKLVNSAGRIVVPNEEEIQRIMEQEPNTYSLEDFYVFEDVKDTQVLQKNLEEGNFYFTGGKDEKGEWNRKGIEQLNNVTKDYDRTDDAAAKATYDKRMRVAESKDTMLEMRLNQLETTHKAIETEMESVQKIVDDNIENTFKTFG